MCGIVRFYHSNRPVASVSQTIERMLTAIRHRGPDEMGYYYDTRFALGTARLSIIDLASGQQPMCDETQCYWSILVKKINGDELTRSGSV